MLHCYLSENMQVPYFETRNKVMLLLSLTCNSHNLLCVVKELLALRSQDGKAKKRVAAMLKRTKAANKAAIEDAVDNENTAVTLGGEEMSV
jgi:hypothetical protein